MDGTCITYEGGGKYVQYTVLVGNPEWQRSLGSLGTGFIWLRIGTIGRLLWTL